MKVSMRGSASITFPNASKNMPTYSVGINTGRKHSIQAMLPAGNGLLAAELMPATTVLTDIWKKIKTRQLSILSRNPRMNIFNISPIRSFM